MKTTKIPFYLLLGFNLLTWIIYLSNPFLASETDNHYFTLIYVLLNIIFLYLGFKKGESDGLFLGLKRKTTSHSFSLKYMNAYFLFYLLTFTLKYAYELRCPAFDIPGLINRIAIGIANPEIGYSLTLKGAQSFSWLIYTFIDFIDSAFFIVGMLCWQNLKKWQKILLVLLAIVDIIKWFGAGTSFGIMQMCTTLVLIYCITLSKSFLNKKQIISILILVLGIFIAAVVSFGINMEGRAGGEFNDLGSTNINLDSFVYVYFISYLPQWFQDLYQYIAHYLVGGYYNLEYAFNCEFEWCFFLGSTNTMTGLADDIFNLGIEARNYPIHIYEKYGVDPYIYWHSCYTWLANDFSFYLVPFVVFWMGRTACRALIIYRKYKDIVSGVLFILLANTIIFFFANNNYLSGHYFVFIFILIKWYNNKCKCYVKTNCH